MSTLRKVQSGDRLQIPAATWNTLLDVAQERQARSQNQSGEAQPRGLAAGIVMVKNTSGANRERFDVLGVDGPIFTPTDSEQAFTDRVALKGVTPAEDDHLGRFVILAEPVKAGLIARAYVFGVCPVKLDVPDEDIERPFAEIDDGVTSSLKAVRSGSAAILWREGGTGVQWAIVRLGKRAVPQVFPVDLAQTGGSQGDESNPATWTYDVTDPTSGNTLASGADPVAAPHKWQRPSVGWMIPATFGHAHWNDSDELVLGWINEMVDQEKCDDSPPEGQ